MYNNNNYIRLKKINNCRNVWHGFSILGTHFVSLPFMIDWCCKKEKKKLTERKSYNFNYNQPANYQCLNLFQTMKIQ